MSVKKSIITRNLVAAAATTGIVLGAVALPAAAHAATYDKNSGTLSITQAVGNLGSVANPTPDLGEGSWVKLPEDGSTTAYFSNAASRTGSGEYTAIDSVGTANGGLKLGTTQSGGAFSTNTQFAGPNGTFQFDANLLSAATLRFDDSNVVAGYDQLVQSSASDLTGFRIEYPAGSGNTYNVGGSSTTGGIYLDALTGGYQDNSGTNNDLYWLQWRTNIVSADAFDGYEAQFHLEGLHS
ncbi:hypothetical protein J4H92_06880 [Leucobacter weissii]|uniref:PEP-CTERM sorting domain-containing protein n=1 Tax=Leucobacter weissii TaxID=1983706 RepID=A0A939S852_9MICO|nr:hypothetical protein [Leucobacter weissii]MBO1901676.1 hypothetical protein [Leucobacter weissii]